MTAVEQTHLQQLLELEKKLYRKLTETLTITQELADAVERQDQQSIQLLLAERQMPVLELQEIDSYVRLKRVELSHEDAARYDELMRGAPPQMEEERPLAEQLATNRRLHSRLVEVDQQVNRRLCGEKSSYGAGAPSS